MDGGRQQSRRPSGSVYFLQTMRGLTLIQCPTGSGIWYGIRGNVWDVQPAVAKNRGIVTRDDDKVARRLYVFRDICSSQIAQGR